jgi:hypothetical protein
VTLVRAELRSAVAVDLRVRVRNELDGPVLPPRRAGVPEAGWDADGFSGVVPADGRLGVGYACPTTDADIGEDADDDGDGEWGGDGDSDGDGDAGATPAECVGSAEADPVSIEIRGPATEAGRAPAIENGCTPATDTVASAVRSLGRANPPADAVPVDAETGGGDPLGTDGSTSRDADVPAAVREWLDAVETRIDRGERLDGASAAEAAATLDACGGIDGIETLPDDLSVDLASLRAAADRIDGLVSRAAATDPAPVVASLSEAASRER